jgi:hypothetical protein
MPADPNFRNPNLLLHEIQDTPFSWKNIGGHEEPSLPIRIFHCLGRALFETVGVAGQ